MFDIQTPAPRPKPRLDAWQKTFGQDRRSVEAPMTAAFDLGIVASAIAVRRRSPLALAAAIPPCPHCGGKVERAAPGGPLPVYCSERCRNLERHKRWRKKAKRPSQPGRCRSKTRLPAMCVECGTDFMARHPLTLTCGEVCGKERRLRDARARAPTLLRSARTCPGNSRNE